MVRYTKTEREQILAKWREDGISAAEFCRQNGIRVATFYRWKKASGAGSGTSFVKVEVPTHTAATGSAMMTLEKGGWRISVVPEPSVVRTVFDSLGLSRAD